MTNIDEFKTVITLTGNKRLPHLEEEIFADEELTTLYLTNLCKELKYYSGYNVLTDNPYNAYIYARDVLQCRWLIAEPIIRMNRHCWARYSSFYL